jgi:ADP-heptose:LPS heptosyltransferase
MIFRLKKNPHWSEQDFGAHRGRRSVCVSRYGAIGDMMQTSSILPGLKRQGFRVTMNTTPKGHSILRHDPHIDDWFIQEDNFVPNEELGEYWFKMEQLFGRFILLAESVEASLLAIHNRREAGWHPAFRRMVMGTVDYLEATHAIAEVPLPPEVAFYPTLEEKAWAKRFIRRLGENVFTILWPLAGSALYKVWPHIDTIFARILITYPNARIITCGGESESFLQIGWEKEKRVVKCAGKMTIRATLALANEVDLVIGPETGVLNAVSMRESVPKILMLSHSSIQNIGGNWKNTVVLTPEDTPCYPCHILHVGFDSCTRDERTGAALCAANITPEAVWPHIQKFVEAKK